jgi:hypothetical protein
LEVTGVSKRSVVSVLPTLIFVVLAMRAGWPLGVILVALVPAAAIIVYACRTELPTSLRIALVLFGNYLATVLAAFTRYGNLEIVPLGWLPLAVFAVVIPMLWLGKPQMPED